MRVAINFDLPEERADLLEHLHGPDFIHALHELDQELRRMWKYEDKKTIDIEDMRNKIHAALEDRGLLDIFYS